MTPLKIAPYGSWQSPITSDLIVAGSISLGSVIWDGDDIYWMEGRPAEAGRNVLVKRSPDGQIQDVTPPPFNVRTRVHEYGGGSFLISEGTVYFVNFSDQRLYYQRLNHPPQPLTAEDKRCYADLILDQDRDRLICVCEDHTQNDQEPENSLVSVDIQTGEVKSLVSGSDFYSSPRLNSDGTQLAWLSWNHPNLPWDGTYLALAAVNPDGSLGEARCIAGGEEESIHEPCWSPDGRLYFSSDRSGWWNLYRYLGEHKIEAICQREAEFAYPHWVFGLSTYTFAASDKIICTYTQYGRWYLASLNPNTQELTPIDTLYTTFASLHAQGEKLVLIAGSASEPTAAILQDLKTGESTILKRASEVAIDSSYLSQPEATAFPTENGLIAYAWYYPPKNPNYTAHKGELPPLLVKSHGGPTAATVPSYSLRIQYWTSRGFGYLDVNYGGSTGFGREYRQRLDRQWGIVDVDDCVNGAKYLVRLGKVDGNRLAISGGSAGGYTTLAALTFRDTFKAGASYYGVSDLEALAQDTHKFESRYLDRLVGKYPEEKAVYQARSPIYFTDRLSTPIIFFQGLEDKIVPPNQAEMMVEALKNRGLPVAYVPFAGEQHGFRRAETIKRALDGEFYFYSRIFGFEPAEQLEPIDILNFK